LAIRLFGDRQAVAASQRAAGMFKLPRSNNNRETIMTQTILVACAAVVLAAAPLAGATGQLADKKVITLAAAKQIAAAAQAEADRNNLHESIVVLDDSGQQIYFQRGDHAQLATVDVAIAKGRTALLFQRPSKAFEDVVRGGFAGAMTLPGVVAVEGGVPIVYEGVVIGAVGASGGTPALDGKVAAAGAGAIADMVAAK
jgi:uncharacterized protein GlcG (DUF336 family)